MFILSNKLHRAGGKRYCCGQKGRRKMFLKVGFLTASKVSLDFSFASPEVGGFSPTSMIQTWYLSEKKACFFILCCQTSCLACRQPTCDWFLWFLYFVLHLFFFCLVKPAIFRFVTSWLAHQSLFRRGRKRKTWWFLVLLQNGSSEKREVRQFQFTAWPDHGVPEYPTPFLAFLRRVKTCNPPDAGPIIAHCRSAATFKWLNSSILMIWFLFHSNFHKDSIRQRYLE